MCRRKAKHASLGAYPVPDAKPCTNSVTGVDCPPETSHTREIFVELRDTVALVTGGSEGIGRAIAEALTNEDSRVTITGRREDAVRSTAEELGLDWIVGDVGNEEDAVRTVSSVIEKHGRLDILVNNAGYGLFKPLIDTTFEELRGVFSTNVFGPFLMAREAAR